MSKNKKRPSSASSPAKSKNSYLQNEVPFFVDTTEKYYAKREKERLAAATLMNDEKTKKSPSSGTARGKSSSPIFKNKNNNLPKALTPRQKILQQIQRDENGKILLTPSPPRNRVDFDDDDDKNNNEDSEDEEIKIQMLKAKQAKKTSPSYSAHQRAAARKSQH